MLSLSSLTQDKPLQSKELHLLDCGSQLEVKIKHELTIFKSTLATLKHHPTSWHKHTIFVSRFPPGVSLCVPIDRRQIAASIVTAEDDAVVLSPRFGEGCRGYARGVECILSKRLCAADVQWA